MKFAPPLAAVALLWATGCGPSRDEISLQPYTNMPSGTVVIAQVRIHGPWEVLWTNECVLEGFEDGFVNLRDTNGLHLGYPGRMVKSIERKEMRK
jgi:hypothetical protein